MTPLTAYLLSIAAMVGVPLAFVAAAWAKGGRPRTLALGALMYLCALPLLVVAIGVGSAALDPLGAAILLSLTAGITEELSRWFWFSRARSKRPDGRRIDGIMAGLGHGGLEALWFALPAAMIALGIATDNLIDGFEVPGTADILVPGLLRPVFVLGHVGFSLAVWTGVRLGERRWLWGAIAVHILADLVGFGGPILFPELTHGLSAALVIAVFVGGAWVFGRAGAAEAAADSR